MLRPMAPTDRAAVGHLVRQLGYVASDDEVEARIRDIVPRPDHLLLVAEYGVVVGWVHAYLVALVETPRFVEVGGLVVSDTARRRGTGTLLMREAEGWAAELGVDQVRLRSNLKRKGAHRFYRAIGYEVEKKSSTFVRSLGASGET